MTIAGIDTLTPFNAILSFSVTSRSDLMWGLVVLRYPGSEVIAAMPVTSVVPRVRSHRKRNDGGPAACRCVAPDSKVLVYTFDVFHETFLPGKTFETIERAVQYQRHEQERLYPEQEAEPELFGLPLLSSDPDLIGRLERDAEYKKRMLRDLKGDARSRGRRH